jgi:hypothetical protein
LRTVYWAAIIVVVIFVALVALGAAVGPAVGPAQQSILTGVSNSSSSTSVGSSSTSMASNSCCTMQVTKVTLDNVLRPGSPYYYIAVDVGYSGSDSWSVDSFNFQVISNTGAIYSVTYSQNAANELQDVTLQNGQHDVGELTFQLNSGQVPTTLEYVSPGFQIQAPVPSVSSWVSSVNTIDTVLQGPNASLSSIYVFGSLQNNTYYFRTGNTMAVKLAITYSPYGQPGSIRLISVTDSDSGFSILKIQPALPATITGNGQELDVVVYLSAPAATYSGDLHLTLTFSY